MEKVSFSIPYWKPSICAGATIVPLHSYHAEIISRLESQVGRITKLEDSLNSLRRGGDITPRNLKPAGYIIMKMKMVVNCMSMHGHAFDNHFDFHDYVAIGF